MIGEHHDDGVLQHAAGLEAGEDLAELPVGARHRGAVEGGADGIIRLTARFHLGIAPHVRPMRQGHVRRQEHRRVVVDFILDAIDEGLRLVDQVRAAIGVAMREEPAGQSIDRPTKLRSGVSDIVPTMKSAAPIGGVTAWSKP